MQRVSGISAQLRSRRRTWRSCWRMQKALGTVSPDDIKRLRHAAKLTISKANPNANICTATIRTNCKNALALYRQRLTLFRELYHDGKRCALPGARPNRR